MSSKIPAIALLAFAPLSLAADKQPPAREINFAQITDAHVFDEGKRDRGPAVYLRALDARTALHWAIDAINTSVEQKEKLDFVVFTGDFGLENVFFSEAACSAVPFRSLPNLPAYSADLAAKEMALELGRLNVPLLFILAGNNDLIDEQVVDGSRFDCFFQKLRDSLRALSSPLDIRKLGPDATVDIQGFRIAGLNSASFKDASKYQYECNDPTKTALTPVLTRGCPAPQLQSLDHLIDAKPSPLLLFTHVPDLVDAFGKEKDPALTTSSWALDAQARKTWETLVSKPQLVAIFAGHFHLNKASIYGSNKGTASLYVSPNSGRKTWVAPPLAGKFQPEKDQVRGFLRVRVSAPPDATVTATVIQFSADTPPTESSSPTAQDPSDKSGSSNRSFVMSSNDFALHLVVIIITGLFGGYLNYLRSRPKPSVDDQRSPYSPPWYKGEFVTNLGWSIAAAILVPLFLHLIGSNVVDNITSAAGTDYSKVLVFAGFCLVAAIYAQSFVTSISDRVLRIAEEAKRTGQEAKEEASNAKQQASETQSKLDPLWQSLTEPDQIPTESVAGSRMQLTQDEKKVLKALADPEYRLRSVAGICADTGIALEEVPKVLATLKEKNLAQSSTLSIRGDEKKDFRWFISPEGRKESGGQKTQG